MPDPRDMLTPAELPIRPWDYHRRRRLLANMTIPQAARSFWSLEWQREAVEEVLASFEKPGVLIKPWLLANRGKAFSFDIEVYRQLQEPALFHPRLCRCCCSTEMEPRETWDGASSRLEPDGICTACHEDIAHHLEGRRAA